MVDKEIKDNLSIIQANVWCGLVISLTCLKWRKDETSEHRLFEFSSIILAWLFYECFQELEERVIKKFDFA